MMNSSTTTPSRGAGHVLAWLGPVCFALFVAFYWTSYFVWPEFCQHNLRGEDRLVEWLTFLGFLIAAITTVRILRFRSSMPAWAKLYIIGLALFFFMCAGEEISWGQRIFGFATPNAVEKQNEQKEFNLHNLNLKHVHPEAIVSWLIKSFGVIAPLALLAIFRKRDSLFRLCVPPPYLVTCFLFPDVMGFVLKHMKPYLINRFGHDVYTVVKLDSWEITEMFWGLSVMLAAAAMYAAWRRSRSVTSL